MSVIHIDIITDFVCVWCFVLHRNVHRAIHLYHKTYRSTDVFEITYRPYYLKYNRLPGVDYETPPESLPKSVIAEKKLAYMSAEKREAITTRLHKIGRAVGIEFKHGGNIGRTDRAHRLVHVARSDTEVQEKLLEMLFSAFHEQEIDISDKDVLMELAESAGMNKEDVQDALDDESEVAKDVDEQEVENRIDVDGKGVPVIIVWRDGDERNKVRIDGAGDVMEFMDLFVSLDGNEVT